MSSFLYFAYGSNMLTERLAARCPSARPIGAAVAGGFVFQFSKLSSVDGSGKATLVARPESEAHGALFQVDMGERDALDRHEGTGYRRIDNFEVVKSADGRPHFATVYLGRRIVAGLRPFDWYKALVVTGARQHGLPDGHVGTLGGALHEEDPVPHRETRLEAVRALQRAGISNYAEILGARQGGIGGVVSSDVTSAPTCLKLPAAHDAPDLRHRTLQDTADLDWLTERGES